jgi:putative transposase
MPRPARNVPDGTVHHVLNRANARAAIFHKPADYDHFLYLLAEAKDRTPMRILGFCVMKNHWHLVLWPASGVELSAFMGWLTNAHVRNHHTKYGTCGNGHIYQGRYKNFIIQDDRHLLTVLRYVEANALRAGLVERAEDWPWSSAHTSTARDGRLLLSPSPVPRPPDWHTFLNEQPSKDLADKLRLSVKRSAPFGEETWCRQTAAALGLESTLRPFGRPRKGDSHLFT